MGSEKKCNRCLILKPSSCFYKDKTRPDGLQGSCSDCQRVVKKKHFELNRKRIKKRVDLWRENNKEKRHAHRMVELALLSGSIKKPVKCSVCKKRRRLDGHHEDYSKPLDVTWLCREHHIARHKEIAE